LGTVGGPLVLAYLLHGLPGIPDHDGAGTGITQAFPVGAERHARERRAFGKVTLPLEGQDLLAAGHVPQVYHSAHSRTGQALAIGTVGYAGEDVVMPLEGHDQPTAGRVPDPHCPVPPCTGHMLTIGAEGRAARTSDQLLSPDLLTTRHVPQLQL